MSGGMGWGGRVVVGEEDLDFEYILVYYLIGSGMWEKEEFRGFDFSFGRMKLLFVKMFKIIIWIIENRFFLFFGDSLKEE